MHYIGIAHVSSPRLRALLWTMSALSVVAAIFGVLGTALFCTPVRRMWTLGEAESCNPFAHVPLLLAFSFVNVMLDALSESRPDSPAIVAIVSLGC